MRWYRYIGFYSCATIFKFFYGPLNFPLGANFYQKLTFLAILGAVRPHLKTNNSKSWRDCGDLGLPPARQIV